MSHGGMDHGGGDGGPACKVSMLWNWYTTDACFLAESWQITTAGSFAATCIGVVLLVVILEALRRLGKEYDALILRRFQADVAASRASALAAKSANLPGCQGGTGGCGPAGPSPLDMQSVIFRASPLQQFIRSAIHAVTLGLAYIVMLLAMYFNGYIIICIVLGGFVGKFFCDWMVVRVGLLEDVPKSQGIEEPTMCCS